MRLAIVTTDVREHKRDYGNPVATFGTAPAALLEGLALLPEVEVHVLSCARRPMRSQKKLADNTWFHSLHVPRIGWMRTAYQGCIRAVRRKLRELRPDIVHGEGTELDCAIDAVLSGFPNVITLHGNMRLLAPLARAKPFSFLWLAARLEAFTIPRAQGVVCITQYTQAAVSGLARQSWVVPNAVEGGLFDITPVPVPGTAPRVLCAGVICKRKNQNDFIRALDPLAGRMRFEVVFLGEGPAADPYKAEFESLVRTRPWCTHAGFANRDQFRAHLGTASLLVLPSIEDNCPMVVLEAMAAGVPVIASRVGGVPDLVEDGQTGLFCDPMAPSTIAVAVEKVLADRSVATELAERAKARARARFHPAVIAQAHLGIYREILRTAA